VDVEALAAMRALVINAGSSSLKVSLFAVGEDLSPVTVWEKNLAEGARLEDAIAGRGGVDVVGHRIVHGGDRFRESVRITPEVRAATWITPPSTSALPLAMAT